MCRNSVRWLYELDQNFTWDSGHPIPEDLAFEDRTGAVRLIIEQSGRITVSRGYAWNGCSPKVCVLDLLLGTPEGVVHASTRKSKTYYASLVHDALYQFLPDGLPLKRRHADAFFLRLLRESDFAPRWVYWAAVRLFGGLVRRTTRLKRKLAGTRVRVVELLPPASASS